MQGDITNFAEANTTKPLYPGVSGDWLSLDDDEEARQALAALPPHLRGVLEEEGRQVQLCRPDSLRGKLECWASPLNGLLQVLVVRAMDLLQGRNPFWTEACWLEVRGSTRPCHTNGQLQVPHLAQTCPKAPASGCIGILVAAYQHHNIHCLYCAAQQWACDSHRYLVFALPQVVEDLKLPGECLPSMNQVGEVTCSGGYQKHALSNASACAGLQLGGTLILLHQHGK